MKEQTHRELINISSFFGCNDLKHELTNGDTANNKRDGAAIVIRQTLLPFVKGIYSTNGRMMKIRRKTGNSIKKTYRYLTHMPHI